MRFDTRFMTIEELEQEYVLKLDSRTRAQQTQEEPEAAPEEQDFDHTSE